MAHSDKSATVRCLLDTGAQASFCSEKIISTLQIPTTPNHLTYVAIGNLVQESSRAATILLKSRITPFSLEIRVNVASEITGVVQSISYDPKERFPTLKERDKVMADIWPQAQGVEVDVIIGQDSCWKIMGMQLYQLKEKAARGLIFSDSPFGTIVQGVDVGKRSPVATILATGSNPLAVPGVNKEKKTEPALEALLKKFFTLESLGITAEPESELNIRQQWATKYLMENMSFDPQEKRYTVKIPFDPEGPRLLNNFESALSRLQSLERHLKSKAVKKRLYDEAMEKYLTSGHAEKLPDAAKNDLQAFYIPHSGVLKGEDEKAKLRIVFDCSAVDRRGNSLNTTMVDAPVPEADLLRILLGFRQHPYAFTADVKSCFLQIKLHPDQVDMFRFLWRKNDSSPPEIFRFTSIIFGSKCSPWISSTCLFDTLRKFQWRDKQLVEKSMRSLWVDDFGFSMPTLQAAQRDRQTLEGILLEGSFHLSKYAASDQEILGGVPEEERIFPKGTPQGVTKILGQPWNVATDRLVTNEEWIPKLTVLAGQKVTRRVVARGVASIFDPLGTLAPWVIVGKTLLKEIWADQRHEAERQDLSPSTKRLWDIPVKKEFADRFVSWAKQAMQTSLISLPRCLVLREAILSQELHVFCDASTLAMCTVAYMVTQHPKQRVSVFLCSKTKTAPMQGITLPRAELVATLMGSRLAQSVKEYLDQEDIHCHFWTDSTVALHWLRREPSKWKPFVANRVQEVQKLTKAENWRHVPTDENAADLGTRGLTLLELSRKPIWFQGPEFLITGEWPAQPQTLTEDDRVREEKKAENVAVMAAAKTPISPIKELWTRHSSFYKVLRLVAWVLKVRFPTPDLYVTQEELNRALMYLLRDVQKEKYAKEIRLLEKPEKLPPSHPLLSVDPFLDQMGMLRVRGRVDAALDLPYEQRHPLILPDKNPVVRKLIQHVHECNNHAGADWCLRYLRRSYWIHTGRTEVKSSLKECMTCRKIQGKRVVQKTAPLPPERTAVREPVFHHMALDEMGPIPILDDRGEEQKAYVLVVACMTFRAIHLEVLRDLSYESLMLALRRTFALYGIPRYVRLDSFPTHLKVKSGFDLIEGEPSPVEIRERSKAFGIKWSWSQKYQPSTNGVIERLVGLVKKCMQKSFMKEVFTHDQLTTLVAEVKRTVNNRPLTSSYVEADEHPSPVCPNDLIYGRALESLPYTTRDHGVLNRPDSASFLAGWENRKRILNRFQTLFMDQWTKTLLTRQNWKVVTDNLRAGDLVLVSHPLTKRREWPLGVIEQALKGRDGLVRSCIIRVKQGPRVKSITRSVRSLVLLKHLENTEVDSKTAPVQDETPDSESDE